VFFKNLPINASNVRPFIRFTNPLLRKVQLRGTQICAKCSPNPSPAYLLATPKSQDGSEQLLNVRSSKRSSGCSYRLSGPAHAFIMIEGLARAHGEDIWYAPTMPWCL